MIQKIGIYDRYGVMHKAHTVGSDVKSVATALIEKLKVVMPLEVEVYSVRNNQPVKLLETIFR